MQSIAEIRAQLEWGDQKTIAKAASASVDTVRKVLHGTRSADTKTGRRIVVVALRIIKLRKDLAAQLEPG